MMNLRNKGNHTLREYSVKIKETGVSRRCLSFGHDRGETPDRAEKCQREQSNGERAKQGKWFNLPGNRGNPEKL